MNQTLGELDTASTSSDLPSATDETLLRRYAAQNDEDAFNQLVHRRIGMVYSFALRKTGNPDLAQDIVQGVFIALSARAKSLGPKVIISGWLFKAVRFAASDLARQSFRRKAREQKYMNESHGDHGLDEHPHMDLAPEVEDAMARLKEKHRNILLLTFYENRSAEAVGAALGISAEAARKRTSRAVDALRKILKKSSSLRLSTLPWILAHAGHGHAPSGLATQTLRVALSNPGPPTGIAATVIRAEKVESWIRKVRICSAAFALSACLCVSVGLLTTPVLLVFHQVRATSTGDERAYVATLFAPDDNARLHLHIRAARMQAEWDLKNEVRNHFGQGAVHSLAPFLTIKPLPWTSALRRTDRPVTDLARSTFDITKTPAGWREVVPLDTNSSLENQAMTEIITSSIKKLRANGYTRLDEILLDLAVRTKNSQKQ